MAPTEAFALCPSRVVVEATGGMVGWFDALKGIKFPGNGVQAGAQTTLSRYPGTPVSSRSLFAFPCVLLPYATSTRLRM